MASTAATRALHQFIFENDVRIDNVLETFKVSLFAGDGTSEYVNKFEYARGLTIGDLISCYNILDLEYHENKKEMISRICHGLMDLNTLMRDEPNETVEGDEKESKEPDEDNEDDNGERSIGDGNQ